MELKFFYYFCLLSWIFSPTVGFSRSFSCDSTAVVHENKYSVFNNVWGVTPKNDPVAGFSQCMIVDGNEISFQWVNFSVGQGRVKSYPHVTVGWDWNNLYTNNSILPLSVNDASRLKAKFDIYSKGEGTYNIAFDIWISKIKHPDKPREQLTHEVMIWLDKKNWKIPRKRWSEVKLNDQVYDIYLDPTPYGRWRVISFVAQEPILSADLSLDAFFSYLKSVSVLDGNEYVNGISLGSEVASGSGSILIKNFDISY